MFIPKYLLWNVASHQTDTGDIKINRNVLGRHTCWAVECITLTNAPIVAKIFLYPSYCWLSNVFGGGPQFLLTHLLTTLRRTNITQPPNINHLICGWNHFYSWHTFSQYTRVLSNSFEYNDFLRKDSVRVYLGSLVWLIPYNSFLN